MAESSTASPQAPDRHDTHDIVVGRAVRLRRINDIHASLRDSGLSRRALNAWIRALNIPILHIGSYEYVNVHFFYAAVYSISRPGNPDFLVPGCDQIKKARVNKTPAVRTLSSAYFNDHLHTFISEIITFRRFNQKHTHRGMVESMNAIVDRVTSTFDVIRSSDAVRRFQAETHTNLKNAHAPPHAQPHPLQIDDERVTSRMKGDVDPRESPLKNLTPLRKDPHGEDNEHAQSTLPSARTVQDASSPSRPPQRSSDHSDPGPLGND